MRIGPQFAEPQWPCADDEIAKMRFTVVFFPFLQRRLYNSRVQQ